MVDNSHGILYLRRNGATWHPVCDADITDREANVVCRSMGFIRGKAQCCNAVGSRLRMEGSVNSVTCTGSETDINKCTMSMEGSCSTGQYAYVHCSYSEFPDGKCKQYNFTVTNYFCRESNHTGAVISELLIKNFWTRLFTEQSKASRDTRIQIS